MKKTYNKDNSNVEVVFSEDLLIDDQYIGSIVIPFFQDKFVMTYHSGRNGWEFPEGKREASENLLQCGIRETFEKTGAILLKLDPIGYYKMKENGETLKMLIYIGDIAIFEPKPRWSEADLVKLFDKLPKNTSLKGQVYKKIIDYIKAKG